MKTLLIALALSIVTYRGEEIHLSRKYASFEEYQDDEHNLAAAEVSKVAALVRSAPVASSYPSHKAAFKALSELMFPGYGFSAMNLGKPVALFALEIPQMNEQRYLAFLQKEGAWHLVDDFTWSDSRGFINGAEMIDGRIRYLGHQGQLVREMDL